MFVVDTACLAADKANLVEGKAYHYAVDIKNAALNHHRLMEDMVQRKRGKGLVKKDKERM